MEYYYECLKCRKNYTYNKGQELNLNCNTKDCFGVLNQSLSSVLTNDFKKKLFKSDENQKSDKSKAKIKQTEAKEELNSSVVYDKIENHLLQLGYDKKKSLIKLTDYIDEIGVSFNIKNTLTKDEFEKFKRVTKPKDQYKKQDTFITIPSIKKHLIKNGYNKDESIKIITNFINQNKISLINGSINEIEYNLFKKTIPPKEKLDIADFEYLDHDTTDSTVDYHIIENYLISVGFNSEESFNVITQYLNDIHVNFNVHNTLSSEQFKSFKQKIETKEKYYESHNVDYNTAEKFLKSLGYESEDAFEIINDHLNLLNVNFSFENTLSKEEFEKFKQKTEPRQAQNYKKNNDYLHEKYSSNFQNKTGNQNHIFQNDNYTITLIDKIFIEYSNSSKEIIKDLVEKQNIKKESLEKFLIFQRGKIESNKKKKTNF